MELNDLATSVLVEYGIENASLTFLRHNENAVYRVELPDGNTCILRLHIPAPGLSGDALMHKREWLEGELRFIGGLHDYSDIVVQQPVLTKEGKLLAEIPDDLGTASLLSWLPGIIFDESAGDAEKNAGLVGELAAKMHDFVSSWSGSEDLDRPMYDSGRVMDAAAKIRDGIDLGLFSESMYRDLVEGAGQICIEMDRENGKPGSHGLIHSDLGLGNLIINGDVISPIDFGLCGYGPFLFDLGGLMGTFNTPALRKAAVDGYSGIRPVSADDFRAIEAFFLSTIYFFMSLHLRNAPMQEWFGRRLPSVINDYIRPFIDGEPFLHKLIG